MSLLFSVFSMNFTFVMFLLLFAFTCLMECVMQLCACMIYFRSSSGSVTEDEKWKVLCWKVLRFLGVIWVNIVFGCWYECAPFWAKTSTDWRRPQVLF